MLCIDRGFRIAYGRVVPYTKCVSLDVMSASDVTGVRSSSNAIPINSLSTAELQGLREKVDAEVRRLHSSKLQLQRVLNAFNASDAAITKLGNTHPGDEMLIPLTGSLYVAGRIASVENVLIDVGTGYFVEQPVPQAKDYCKRKAAYLTQNIQDVTQVSPSCSTHSTVAAQALVEKQKASRTITQVLDSKLQQEST